MVKVKVMKCEVDKRVFEYLFEMVSTFVSTMEIFSDLINFYGPLSVPTALYFLYLFDYLYIENVFISKLIKLCFTTTGFLPVCNFFSRLMCVSIIKKF